MTLHLVTPPAVSLLALAEVKAMAGLDGLDETQDAVIAAHLQAATQSIDGANGWLGRQLVNAPWELRLDEFPWHGAITVPLPPLQSITSITYVDQDGVDQVVADYQVAGVGGSRPGRVYPAFSERWPSTRAVPEAVKVQFVAGFGPSWNNIPEPLRQAIALMVRDAYDGCSDMSPAAESLLFSFRVW